MTEEPKGIPIVQYSDSDGNKAYAYTHWQAIVGKPEMSKDLTVLSPNGAKYILSVNDEGKLLINGNIYPAENNTYQEQIDSLKDSLSTLADSQKNMSKQLENGIFIKDKGE